MTNATDERAREVLAKHISSSIDFQIPRWQQVIAAMKAYHAEAPAAGDAEITRLLDREAIIDVLYDMTNGDSPYTFPDIADAIITITAQATEPATVRADTLEEACARFEQRMSEGYPTPANKVDPCEHGKWGWEDCIACYDYALLGEIAAIRALGQPHGGQG